MRRPFCVMANGKVDYHGIKSVNELDSGKWSAFLFEKNSSKTYMVGTSAMAETEVKKRIDDLEKELGIRLSGLPWKTVYKRSDIRGCY